MPNEIAPVPTPADEAMAPPELAAERAEEAARLARFRGPLEERDAEVIEYWRQASPAAHAAAMIELAHYAEQMVAQTGLGKDPNEMFPSFPLARRAAQPPEGQQV